MKKSIIALFAAILIASCSNKETKNNLTISGTIKGFSVGKLYLEKAADSGFTKIDSLIIDGKSNFSFDTTIDEPQMMYLTIDRGTTNSIDDKIPFFAEPGTIEINSDLKQFYASAKIVGSKNQELYNDYKLINSKFTNQNLDYTKQILNAQKHQLSVKLDSLLALQSQNVKRKYLYTINFAITNKDKAIAPYIALSEIPDANIKYLDTIYKSLTPEIAKSKYGTILNNYINDLKKQ